MLKVKCKHCNAINEIEYGDMRAGLMGNHFFKFRCTTCGNRTLLKYCFDLIAIDDSKKHQTTEQAVEKTVIE